MGHCDEPSDDLRSELPKFGCATHNEGRLRPAKSTVFFCTWYSLLIYRATFVRINICVDCRNLFLMFGFSHYYMTNMAQKDDALFALLSTIGSLHQALSYSISLIWSSFFVFFNFNSFNLSFTPQPFFAFILPTKGQVLSKTIIKVPHKRRVLGSQLSIKKLANTSLNLRFTIHHANRFPKQLNLLRAAHFDHCYTHQISEHHCNRIEELLLEY